MSSPFSGRTILIRQAKDPFVSDVQYIAYSKATLDERGRLNMRDLSLRGVPGASFWIVTSPGFSDKGEVLGTNDGFISVEECSSLGEDGWIAVIESKDMQDGFENQGKKPDDESRERRIQYWTGLLRTVSASAARIFAFPASTTANMPEACIRQGSDNEPSLNGFKDDGPLVVVAERLNVLDRSGLSRRHVEESRVTEECIT